jgi:Uncharacterized protein conserved in bacteria
MRFMIVVKASPESEAGVMPSEQLIMVMQKFHEELARAGMLLDASGLKPSSQGWRVEYSRGKAPRVVDGPFAETKELIAGYTIIQAKSREDALDWTRRFPNPSPDGAGSAQIEVRPFYELEDFAPGEAVEKFKELRSELEQKKQQQQART